MSEKVGLFLFSWILTWSLTAAKQLSITYNYAVNNSGIITEAKKDESKLNNNDLLNQTGDYDFEFNEEVKLEETTKVINCDDEEFWNQVKAEIIKSGGEILLEFPSVPVQNKIVYLNLQFIPNTVNYRTLLTSYHMHGIKSEKISTHNLTSNIKLELVGGLKEAPILGWDVQLEARDGNNKICYTKRVASLTSDSFSNYTTLTSFYRKGILNYANETNFQVDSIGKSQVENEMSYLDSFFLNQRLKNLNNFLPLPTEVGVALLTKTVRSGERELVEDTLWRRNYLYGDVVLGLFGSVHTNDLETVDKLIQTLHIVAPNLNIKYSDNPSEVNLPIHIAPCEELFSDYVNACKDRAAGLFTPPNVFDKEQGGKYGLIWVDAKYANEYRSHIIVHEMGHALGLGHNLCYDSVMSYSNYAPTNTYFSALDLMQLRILYDSKYTVPLGAEYTIDTLNLNYDTFLEYESGEKNVCESIQGGWGDVIDFQQGLLEIDEIFEGKR